MQDHTAAWRQAKRALGITAAALNMQVRLVHPESGQEICLPFVGHVHTAVDLAMTATGRVPPPVCNVDIFYGLRRVALADIAFHCALARRQKTILDG